MSKTNQNLRKTMQDYKFIKIILFTVSLSSFLMSSCAEEKVFFVTNEVVQSKDELKKIEKNIKKRGDFKSSFLSSKKYFYHEGKRTDIYYLKNKSDNRLYIGVKRDKYVSTLEINNDSLQFSVFNDPDELYEGEKLHNYITFILNDENRNLPSDMGRDQHLVKNHSGEVCEYDEEGKLKFCIKRNVVYKPDSLGVIKKRPMF